MYSVIRLNETHSEVLEEFCYEAGLAGYANNASLEAMKFNGQYDLKDTPSFWAVFKDYKIISVSGCHYWYDDFEEPSMMRCLFRSATLPHYDNVITGLNKYHMNSLPFSVMLPLQINQGLRSGVKHFYITTSNSDHDASGKMKRTHRVLQLLARTGIVKFDNDEIVYSTPQTKWEINLDLYLEALRGFHTARGNAGIESDREYLDIVYNGFSRPWEGFCIQPNDALDTQTSYLYTKYSHQY
jgi:hypothetical protein